ncbi:DUF2255 family protein [Paractinoplanes atraurantiacus]|uniref:DUF2255 family protein n=1 Tax=Paractinoplanes atraurantiacus TaxID=1036182 RepID=A0A285JTB7_9ACTN|nr:DUF2255 family protein [Actinoplanes atraurantiacus]SNY63007.1 hypothetical protein SAMN05421748_124159 [Actinoplanes atraurantiacus]
MWSSEEVELLAASPSLVLSVGRERHEGVELGMVVVDGGLYVRAFRGRRSAWFQAALTDPHGHISTTGLERDVLLSADPGPAETLDAAYRAKYGANAGLVAGPQAHEATLRIAPSR